MSSLYQKYRPQRFEDLVGQEWISKIFKKVLKEGRHSHAYLFTGARGTGKTSTARIVAKALNCLNSRDGEPCNDCANCRSINENKFLDLFEIDAASNRGIDQIRDLKEKINFSPSQGSFKVYIIDEVHMLTNEAFNALLKTLEEPPVHTVFMLATTEPHKIPLTIISRTQRFDFKLANDEDLKNRIRYILQSEQKKMEDRGIEIVIQGAGGSFRDAETILDKILGSVSGQEEIKEETVRMILGLTDEKAVEDMMRSLLDSDLIAALKILNQVNDKGLSLYQFLKQILEFGRKMIYNKIVSKRSILDEDFDLKKLVKIIKILTDATYQIKVSVIPILAFEIAIVDICADARNVSSDVPTSNSEVKKSPKLVKQEIKVERKKAAATLREVMPEEKKVEPVVLEETAEEHVVKKEENEENESSEGFEEIPLENVTNIWGDFLERVRPHNFHLQAFLSKARPTEIKGDKLVLRVPFKFHKDKIETHASRKFISDLFKSLVNVALVPTCEVSEDLRVEEEEEEIVNNADLVEQIFGDMLENEAAERNEKID